jgi:hypothetical protein
MGPSRPRKGPSERGCNDVYLLYSFIGIRLDSPGKGTYITGTFRIVFASLPTSDRPSKALFKRVYNAALENTIL